MLGFLYGLRCHGDDLPMRPIKHSHPCQPALASPTCASGFENALIVGPQSLKNWGAQVRFNLLS